MIKRRKDEKVQNRIKSVKCFLISVMFFVKVFTSTADSRGQTFSLFKCTEINLLFQ